MIVRRYGVILADPPWTYRNKRTGGSMTSGAAAKYPTMTIDDICALPIKELADPNSVLFLWVTTPMMPEGLRVMESWGFAYKTKIYWRKIMSLGMGFWFRGQVEELWLGVRGRVKPFRLQEANIIQCKVLGHSEKPPAFHELIERATAGMTNRARLELFARRVRPGWDAWGNEVDSTISSPLELERLP